ncbi:GNAT family N-acetyltransferase [Nocardioides sambongensis]|uniref:GNAT family N-acetyltransferase n=1 Tax=Nocardioides sambongensis TaxID=2589074 RepID=UPI00112D67EE|nr:GNAT family protein [Nocardioides sambongensis]
MDAQSRTDPTGPTLAAPPLPVRTARLVLRPLRPADIHDLGYYRDPEVCRFLPFPPTDQEGLRARLDRLGAGTAPSRPGDALHLAADLDGRVIGDVMLRLGSRLTDHDPPAVAEIGWVFSPDVAGLGYATEAARAVVDLAFSHYPLHRVSAQLDPRNTASVRLCERLGLRHEAHTRADFPSWDGSWSDTGVYGILRAEWRQQPGPP